MIPLSDKVEFFKYKEYIDERGYMSVVMDSSYKLPFAPAQINESFAKKYTLKGLHHSSDMAKLIRVIDGNVFELIVDMRIKSSSFLIGNIYNLTRNDGWIYIPKGFGNGMYYLEDTKIEYMFNIEYYNSEQNVINIFDNEINWKNDFKRYLNSNILQSEKDQKGISINRWINDEYIVL